MREDGFPIENVGNDGFLDEFSFCGHADVKRGSGITLKTTVGMLGSLRLPQKLRCSGRTDYSPIG